MPTCNASVKQPETKETHKIKDMKSWESPLETNKEYGYIDALLVEFVSSHARSIILFFSESDANIWAKRRSRQLGLKTKKSRRHRGVFRAYKPDGWTIHVHPIPTKFRYEDARHELAKNASLITSHFHRHR
jgi:hypothetical protein